MIRKLLPGLLLLVLVFSSAIAQEKAYDAERVGMVATIAGATIPTLSQRGA
jgi:hypothetical protein